MSNPPTDIAQATPRILIVDDHDDFGELVRRVAEKAGYDVTVLNRPDRFRDICAEFQPDLICLDIVMPQEDGIELIRWLAAARSRAAVYIVTGHSPSYARAAVEIGRSQGLNIVGILQKPVALSTLREILAAIRPGDGFATAAN